MRSGFSHVQAIVDIVCICSDQVHVFESFSPMYLMVSLSVSIVLFMSNGGCCGGSDLGANIIDNVFPVLKATNHASAQVLMEFKSTLRW